MPCFSGGWRKKFFPVEGVVCVGQVKSSVTSKSQYEHALENLRSVKKLDRSAGFSSATGEPMNPTVNHLHQIFSFVLVTGRCLAEGALRRALFEHIWTNERFVWPNLPYSFDRYLATFSCEHGICPNPMDAFAIGVIKGVENADLFLWFLRLVTQAVSVTHVSSFSYQRYLSKASKWTAYAFEQAPVKSPLPTHLTQRSIPKWGHPNSAD